VVTGPDVKTRLVETGRVRIRFRDFPIPSHPQSTDAHLAAACAGEQGQFFPMHDQLFFGQRDWTRRRRPERRFREYAEALRLDMGRYDTCVDDRRLLGQIEAAKQEGLAVGVHSTPSFIVGGLLVVGALPYDSLVSLVERVEAAGTR
jgi:protein-disulfide isomerase